MHSNSLSHAVLVGLGATAVMDVGGEVIRRTRGVPPLDYRLLGRWVGHMPRGKFVHERIGDAEPVERERLLGWCCHYAIGTGIAVGLVMLRPDWLDRPTLGPALLVGVGSTVAPWLIMQPAFGMGVAASKTPAPTVARLRSLRAHLIYGVGLWGSARLLARIARTQ